MPCLLKGHPICNNPRNAENIQMKGLHVRRVAPVYKAAFYSAQQLWKEHFLFDDCNFQQNSAGMKGGRFNGHVDG